MCAQVLSMSGMLVRVRVCMYACCACACACVLSGSSKHRLTIQDATKKINGKEYNAVVKDIQYEAKNYVRV